MNVRGLRQSPRFAALGLGGEQIRQVRDGIGGRGVDVFCAGGFEGVPADEGEIRGEGDVADEAAPLDYGALDIAGAEGFGEELLPGGGVLDDFADDLGGTGAVVYGDAHLEVAGVIGALVGLLAEGTEAAAERGLVPGEAVAGAEIGEIEYKVGDGVGWVLQRGGDAEAFAIVEE